MAAGCQALPVQPSVFADGGAPLPHADQMALWEPSLGLAPRCPNARRVGAWVVEDPEGSMALVGCAGFVRLVSASAFSHLPPPEWSKL